MAQKIPDYIGRMQVEKADIESFKGKLDERIKKLEGFLKTSKYGELNYHQKDLLDMQLVHMKASSKELEAYHGFLNERLLNEALTISE